MDANTLSLIIGFIGIILGVVCLIYAIYCQKQNKILQETISMEHQKQLNEIKTSISVVGVELVQFKKQDDATKFPEIQHNRDIIKEIQAFFIGITITILIALILDYLTKPRRR